MIGQAVVTVTAAAAGSVAADVTCLADAVTIHHGRDDTTGQPESSTATVDISWSDDEDVLPAAVEIGSVLTVDYEYPPGSGTTYRRFSGRVTDLAYGWVDVGADTPNTLSGQIIAAGALSDLARRVVGDEPWPQELDGARAARVLTLAGVPVDGFTSDPGTVQILARDVDSQSALDVVQGVAASAGGILWEAVDGHIRYADAEHRRNTPVSVSLDACDILVTPTWSRTTSGLVNRVSLGYGVTPDGGEQPRLTDSRQDSIDRYGRYEYTSATELAALADAQNMVSLLLTRNVSPVWVFSELPLDIDGMDDARTVAALGLDMNGLVAVTGLPVAGAAPTTATLWVEGWTETLTADAHDFVIAVSGYCRTVPPPRWDDVDPSRTWDAMGTLTWDDIACLGPAVDYGRWNDVPASMRWNSVDPSRTWDTWESV
jgi:hypothetical protein